MTCPECSGEMIETHTLGIRLNQCSGCLALWFDAGEIEEYARKLASESHGGTGKPHVLASVQKQFEADSSAVQIQCPSCARPALTLGMLRRFQLRCCSECHGVLASRTQVDRIRSVGRIGPLLDLSEFGVEGSWAEVAAKAVLNLVLG